MVDPASIGSVIRRTDIEDTSIEFRLYSFEEIDYTDLELGVGLYLEFSETVIIMTIDEALDAFESIQVTDRYIDGPCFVCYDDIDEPVNVYQLNDHAVQAHKTCIDELDQYCLEFYKNCPEIMSRKI